MKTQTGVLTADIAEGADGKGGRQTSLYQKAVDDAAAAMTEIKLASTQLFQLGERMRECLDGIGVALGKVADVDNLPIAVQERERLRKRIERMEEFRRMMELGSFTIEVERAMTAAWRRLP